MSWCEYTCIRIVWPFLTSQLNRRWGDRKKMKVFRSRIGLLILSVVVFSLIPASPFGFANLWQPVLASTLTAPWADSDIGSVGSAGSASVTSGGVFTINGSGADIYDEADAFHY